jgi:hypothetical protein
MKLVIPVSSHDIHALPALIDALIHFGGLTEHSCFIFYTPSVAVQVAEQAERLTPHMREVMTHQAAYEPELGMPMDGGILFFGAVFNLGKLGNTEPFLWLEIDSTPTATNWLALIENDYKAKGKPCYGNIVPLPFVRGTELIYPPGEEYMMAVGVYPPTMHVDERIRALIMDLGKPYSSNPKENFDTYIRGAVKSLGWANSELIADMWNTHEYVQTADGTTGKARPTDKLVRKREGLVPATALLVHGCKDESLRQIVMANSKKPKVAALAPKPVEPVKEEPKPTAADFLTKQILGKLAKGSYRLTDLAKDTGFTGEDLSALKADVVARGFKVAGPGWITRKEEPAKPVAAEEVKVEEDPFA